MIEIKSPSIKYLGLVSVEEVLAPENKYPKAKNVVVMWTKKEIELSKEQKLPMGRKKKLGG